MNLLSNEDSFVTGRLADVDGDEERSGKRNVIGTSGERGNGGVGKSEACEMRRGRREEKVSI